ncbi:MAG: ELM1/GtrOC1 family putative glycosyltransferase [Candidatus Poribacteria bacterium]|nr:ELM1/GtrOC1 family putative glycosyltransferase [Candidatus Poribacteria bacterium]
MKVVILSDNKPGHYKQSLGIVEKLSESETEWLTVEFRRKWRDNLLRVFMCIFGGTPLPISLIHTLLRWSLTAETYNALTAFRPADIILSTGSSVAAVNLLLGRLLGAKTVTCRRPSPLGVRNFDLAILPMFSWHGKRDKDNVCKTVGVPNPISPDTLNSEQKRLIQKLNLPDCPRIGLLIGGADRHETITSTDAEQLSEICQTVAIEMNAQILVTTSRRTPTEVTAHLASTLKHSAWCPLFIEPDTPSELADPYQAILALSDLLIVTADSFTMVCEAASSGHPVIVLTLSRDTVRKPKRYNAYQYMEHHAIVNQCKLDKLKQHIADGLTSRVPNMPLQDTNAAVHAIRNLIDSN